MRLTIVKKSFLAFALVLIPLIALLAYGYVRMREYIAANTLVNLSAISQTVETQFYQYIDLATTQAKNFASDGLIKTEFERLTNGNADSAVRLSEHLSRNKLPLNKYIQHIDIILPNGRIAASSDPARTGVNVSEAAFFRNAAIGLNLSQDQTDGESKLGIISITVPVTGMKTRKELGFLSAAINLAELDHIINGEFSAAYSGNRSWWVADAPTLEIYLVNNDSKVMLTRSRFIPKAAMTQPVDTMPVRLCDETQTKTRAFYRDYRGIKVAGASECLKVFKWTLLVEQDEDEIFAVISSIRKYAVITGALVVALLTILFSIYYRTIALRLAGLSSAASKLTSGDYAVELPSGPNDEIGELAKAFTTMADSIMTHTASLERSEEKYRSLVANIPDCTWTANERGDDVFISQNVEKIIGYSQEDFSKPGNKDLRLSNIHPDYIKLVKEAYGRLFSENRPFDVEYLYRRKDGEWIWLQDRAMSTYIKDGIRHADGTFSDITDRKKIETSLRESEERMKQAQRIAKIGSWDWDITNNRLVWSDEVYRIFGVEPNEFDATYDAFINSVLPDDRELVKDAVNKALYNHTFYSIDHRIVLPDKSERIVHEEGSVTYDSSGAPTHMYGTVQDITDRVAEEEIAKSLARFPSENPNPVLRATIDGRLLYANMAYQRIFAESIREHGMILPLMWQQVCKGACETEHQRDIDVAQNDRFFSFVFAPITGTNYVNIYGSDITARKRTEFELKKLSMAMEHSVNLVFITDATGKIDYVNPTFETVTGFSKQEAIGQTPRILASGDVPDERYDEMWKTILSGKTWRSEYRNKKKSGGYYWCNSVISPIKNEVGEITHFLAVQEDVTEKKQTEERVKLLSEYDSLTGLINRSKFMNEVSRWIEESKVSGAGYSAALIIFNIDYFKLINETYGHGVADEHLRRLSALFKNTLEKLHNETPHKNGAEPMLGRLSGDEFAVFLPQTDGTSALAAAERLRTAAESAHSPQIQVNLTVSAGIVIYPRHGTDSISLFSSADAARYRAKELGRNRCHLYRPEDHDIEKAHSRFSWKARIETAIKEDRFKPFYQPILDLRDNKVHHYESLARMNDESGAVLLPGSFIDVAERFGLIGAIDRVIIEKVMARQAQTFKAGIDVSFGVNLSGKDLTDEGLLAFLKAKLIETGASPQHIIFEITETAAISDIGGAKEFITPLKALGCRFALDDFGVGFTSFTYLRELQMDYIKIDGSFIRSMHRSHHDRVFVKAISEMAHGLGIKTIAEFVEADEIVELLKGYGVDYAQGYLIGKPAPLLLAEHEKKG